MKKFLMTLGILSIAGAAPAAQITTVLDAANTDDGTLHSSNGFTSEHTLYVGANGSLKGLIRFDLPTLPDDSVIDAAVLQLRKAEAGVALDIDAHAVLENWDVDEVTWTNYDASNAWATPGLGSGTDYEATASGSVTVGEAAGFYDLDITGQYQQWFSGAEANNGLLLLPDSSVAEFIYLSRVTSSFYAHPVLVVDYHVVPEPASLGVLGLAGLLAMRRRHRGA